jgi:RES domain-containing protein
VRVWRMAPARHPLFDGEGTRRFGSRWIPRGVRAIHASATLSLAALDLLVHTDVDLAPSELAAAHIDIPDSEAVKSLEVVDSVGRYSYGTPHRVEPAAFRLRSGSVWSPGAVHVRSATLVPSRENKSPAERAHGRSDTSSRSMTVEARRRSKCGR